MRSRRPAKRHGSGRNPQQDALYSRLSRFGLGRNLSERARLQQRPRRGRAMAVLALLLGWHLAKRLPCPGHEKDRVVAEPSLATPLRHDLPPALALEEPRLPAGRRQG